MSLRRKSKRMLRKTFRAAGILSERLHHSSYEIKFNNRVKYCLKIQRIIIVNNVSINQSRYTHRCRYVYSYDNKNNYFDF